MEAAAISEEIFEVEDPEERVSFAFRRKWREIVLEIREADSATRACSGITCSAFSKTPRGRRRDKNGGESRETRAGESHGVPNAWLSLIGRLVNSKIKSGIGTGVSVLVLYGPTEIRN